MEELMQLGGAQPKLTTEEKSWWKQNNLSLYCGNLGHFIQTCQANMPQYMMPDLGQS